MKLYYTGASSSLGTQPDPSLSKGGHISSSPVSGNSFNNLFPDISRLTLVERRPLIRMVVLKNETDAAQNIGVFYEKNGISNYRMAIVAPTTNDCNEQVFEKISSGTPVSAIFLDNKGKENEISATIEPGSYLGIWVERRINKNAAQNQTTCENLIQQFDASDENQQISITVDPSIDGNTVDGKYFVFNTNESKIILLPSNGSPISPINEQGEILLVNVFAVDNHVEVLTKICDKINNILAERGEITCSLAGSVLNLTQEQSGSPSAPSSPNTEYSFQVTGGDTKLIEDTLDLIIDY